MPKQKKKTVPAVIRKAEPEDVQAIARIDNLSFADGWSADYYRDEVFNPIATLLVADSSLEIAGFLLFWNIPPEMELLRMAVRSDMRSAGTGSALLGEMIAMAQSESAERIFLEVRRSNNPARRLYAKHGFKKTGFREGYYQHPREDAVRMEWQAFNAYKNRDLP